MTTREISMIVLARAATLIGFVFATGQTFGQRCDAAGFSGAEHERCVMRVQRGGPVYPSNIDGWRIGLGEYQWGQT
jgi:hypothetical protein